MARSLSKQDLLKLKKECYTFEDNSWTPLTSLTEPRSQASGTVLDGDHLWITGGESPSTYNAKRISHRAVLKIYYVWISVMRVGSDTFGDPIFQKGLQN